MTFKSQSMMEDMTKSLEELNNELQDTRKKLDDVSWVGHFLYILRVWVILLHVIHDFNNRLDPC